jgi:hypothetical protein
MKTTAELQTEIAALETALQETRTLANERSTLSYRLQVVTAQTVLGKATKLDLENVKRDLDASVEALTRISFLEQAISDLKKQLDYAKGRERSTHCETVRAEHVALYETYKEQSRQVLATFKQLQTLNRAHVGLTGRDLHCAFERELNLPALTGSLCSRSNFTTAQSD